MPLLLALLACAPALQHLPTEAALPWDLHPRLVEGVIGVAPPVVLMPAPEAHTLDLMGLPLDPWHVGGRHVRTRELAALPGLVHAAVPGALFAAMPPGWSGSFQDVALAPGARLALERAARGALPWAEALSQAALRTGGEATLFTWVRSVQGDPLTASNMVGELVLLDGVPVMVDFTEEPYHVRIELGMALVAADGELLFRYEDEYEGLLSAGWPADRLGRHLARALVGDIAPSWLELHEALADAGSR